MKNQVTILCATGLLLAGSIARADFLPNNFWTNAAFEAGISLDTPEGVPAGWARGGTTRPFARLRRTPPSARGTRSL